MVQNGVVVSKLAIIEEYLEKLQDYMPVSMDQFASDWGLQKITERSLQVMIEIMIDIAERIVAHKGMVPQKTATETIKKLQDLGITQNIEAYTKMVRFRNMVVHQYASIKTEIVYSILKNNLNDFRMFIDDIQSMKAFSITSLQAALKQHDKITFALLFGSSKEGRLINGNADVDIALYLSDTPSADILAEIVGLCQDAIQYDNIDLVVLNDADPILSFEALSGRLLVCNNEEAYLSFFSLTCRQYEDEMLRIERSLSYRRPSQG